LDDNTRTNGVAIGLNALQVKLDPMRIGPVAAHKANAGSCAESQQDICPAVVVPVDVGYGATIACECSVGA